jgi:pterin-4a-carbinolamine dehydratase
MDLPPPPDGWKHATRPPMLQRRYEFASYAQTRRFLELMAEESQRTGCYPDLSFGPRHVSVSLHLDDMAEEGRAAVVAFARAVDGYALLAARPSEAAAPVLA